MTITTRRPDTRAALAVDDYLTVTTPMGVQVTVYRNAECWRVTALDCYTRRLRAPENVDNERSARSLARRWTLELLGNHNAFMVEIRLNGTVNRYAGTV
jgi:hypothetical protein